jgi:hypothetical protein
MFSILTVGDRALIWYFSRRLCNDHTQASRAFSGVFVSGSYHSSPLAPMFLSKYISGIGGTQVQFESVRRATTSTPALFDEDIFTTSQCGRAARFCHLHETHKRGPSAFRCRGTCVFNNKAICQRQTEDKKMKEI